ncbi:MAG: glycoside hydrolase family 127 protein [Bacteroidales bacterium]|nr:glycoside hydrolase family 127 protein [Bacteroidales bacterium]
MRKHLILTSIIMILAAAACDSGSDTGNYPQNAEPLAGNAFTKLPLGAVTPEGWLKDQLISQAGGLTGHLDDFWPDLVTSSWKGGEGEAWERGPYYLDGLVPLAYILGDERLKAKSQVWVDAIISSGTETGWFGPAKNSDRWPLAVASKVLFSYFDATGDSAALDVLMNYFRYLNDNDADWPDDTWRGVRAMEHAVTGYQLYRLTGADWLRGTIEKIMSNSFDWTSYYEVFPWDSSAVTDKRIPLNWKAEGLTAHVVNNAMAIKYPGLWYQQSHDERYKNAVYEGLRKYDLHHGQTGGRFSGDEHLSGKSPSQGTELCTVVELMFSLEKLFEVFGDNAFAERLEMLAYNALPGTTTPDMWAHQYDQQSNQVLVSDEKRDWSTNGNESNIYGLMPNFACCLANMHQGWPKFVEHMWMATADGGLAVNAWGPAKVKALVGKGQEVTLTVDTRYPFDGKILITVNTEKPVRFPLHLRTPSWAAGSSILYNGKSVNPGPGSTIVLEEKWSDGNTIEINFPMEVRTEKRYNNSVAVLRGPLYYSLRIGKEYRSVELSYNNFGYMGSADWEIRPVTPWNYGLLLDNIAQPSRGVEVKVNEIGKYPFADTGDMVWSAADGNFAAWDSPAPVEITFRAMKIPEWGMKNNSADVPPVSPVRPSEPAETVTLVPYGAARLRITEFPYMDVIAATPMIGQGN